MKFIENAIKHTIVTRFLVLLIVVGGIFSYFQLGKLEDPEFQIKEALVITLYPGATAEKVELQVTDKVENALQKIPNIEFIESVSRDGYSQVKIKLNEDLPSEEVNQYWDDLRKKMADSKLGLPIGTVPLVLDDYGAVYGMFLTVTGDGYTYNELDSYVKYIKKRLGSVEGISKVEVAGKQAEAIFLDIDSGKLASMNINPSIITAMLTTQNLVSTGAEMDYGNKRVALNLNSDVDTIKEIENLILVSTKLPNGSVEVIRLKDVAEVRRDYVTPYSSKVFFNKSQAMGLSLSPEEGTNVVETGKVLDKELEALKEDLPVGISIDKVYYQPDLVTSAINNFLLNLLLSVVTVVGVLVIIMGLRSSLIIGMGLILSILGTFIVMIPMGIDLQRISLGSFIIAMGMLVDNSIVIVDGVLSRVDKGADLTESLNEVASKNALPLLGATLVAAIAFLPGSLMPTYGGEYVSSSFWVATTSLLLSWFLCLTQTPVYCKLYLKGVGAAKENPKEKKLLDKSRKFLITLIENRKKTILAVGAIFGFSIFLMLNVPRSFFPDSDKKIFEINMWAREGSRIQLTEENALEIRDFLLEQEGVENVTTTVGAGANRFYIASIPQMPNPSYAHFVVNVEELEDINEIDANLREYVGNNMVEVMVTAKKYANGIPTEYPLEVEFIGEDPEVLRELANKAKDIMNKYPNVLNIKTNWRNKELTWEAEYSQIAARKAGISPLDTVGSLMTNDGSRILGRIQSEDEMLPVLLRNTSENIELSRVEETSIWGSNLKANPLSSILKDTKLVFEDSSIWRKNRERSIKVQADIPLGIQAEDIRILFAEEIEAIELPKGYDLHWGGEIFEQRKNVSALLGKVPGVQVVMFSICVWLFSSVLTPVLIFAMLPLSIIGIAPGLLITGKSFGFMATIGVIALAGIMIKNIIVLVDEINYQTNELGIEPKEAVIEAAISRIRAVSLAALTTVFGMVPLLKDPLYGTMAATIIFGLVASTIITLFVFPVVYLIAYKIK